jgi:hypothetical protein
LPGIAVLSLSKKHAADDMNRACETAWRGKATNYRAIKKLLAHRQASQQETMEFMQEHPIIRPVSEYGAFIASCLQGGT